MSMCLCKKKRWKGHGGHVFVHEVIVGNKPKGRLVTMHVRKKIATFG